MICRCGYRDRSWRHGPGVAKDLARGGVPLVTAHGMRRPARHAGRQDEHQQPRGAGGTRPRVGDADAPVPRQTVELSVRQPEDTELVLAGVKQDQDMPRTKTFTAQTRFLDAPRQKNHL